MLWKPREPIFPKLVKNVADGMTFDETKEMRNRGLNSSPLMKLSKQYSFSFTFILLYVSLVCQQDCVLNIFSNYFHSQEWCLCKRSGESERGL